MGSLVAFAVLILFLGAVVWIIAHVVTENRYAKMAEEEFEKEARRTSMLGAGVIELQKHLAPHHKVE